MGLVRHYRQPSLALWFPDFLLAVPCRCLSAIPAERMSRGLHKSVPLPANSPITQAQWHGLRAIFREHRQHEIGQCQQDVGNNGDNGNQLRKPPIALHLFQPPFAVLKNFTRWEVCCGLERSEELAALAVGSHNGLTAFVFV